MPFVLVALGILAVLAAVVWLLRTPAPGLLLFYYQLLRAQQRANRFYAECRWVTKNIIYQPDMPRGLDVYQPETGSGHPVVIYVYGGSWHSGNKELYAPAAQRLVPEGLVFVVPDYTLYPAAGFPRQTQEIAAAIAWTFEHIAEYGGDPRRVVLAAQSAGAQVAALAMLDPQRLAAYNHSASELRGFIGISGVYDFRALLAHFDAQPNARKMMLSVLGGAANAGPASPITFVTPQAPPSLLIHGDKDTTVPLPVSALFYQRLQACGVPSEFITYPGAGHADILFRALTEKPPRLLNDMVAFIKRCTTPDGNPPHRSVFDDTHSAGH